MAAAAEVAEKQEQGIRLRYSNRRESEARDEEIEGRLTLRGG